MTSFMLLNNKGGVGKTTLTFNIAHMLARKAKRVVMLDYDPQCNLSAVALSEDELEEIWERSHAPGRTVASCVDLVRRGRGDVVSPELRAIADNLWLLPGDLALWRFEQPLAQAWPQIQSTDNEQALHVTTALERLMRACQVTVGADLVIIDVGPSLGALNRAAVLAADAVVVPLAPDLFSLQGLKNLGPTLREWSADWRTARSRTKTTEVPLPDHPARPVGYIVQQHLARVDRPVTGYQQWALQIPRMFRERVLEEPGDGAPPDSSQDPYCIAHLKHFASLVPLAQAARKPLFDLKQADGIGGGQLRAVSRARDEFSQLADELVKRFGP